MRTAYEKGYNVITLSDCCAATSQEGHDGATKGTFGMFSSPMSAAEFGETLAPAPSDVTTTPAQGDAMAPAAAAAQ
jgi:nicotinamidase-related amidase